MTTEKHDPWALLREARESVFRDSLCREYDDSHKAAAMEEHRRRTRLLDRIDAALAERQDSAKDVVESEDEWDRVNAHFYTAYPDDETSLTVCRFDLTRQEWRWDMEREVKKRGYCATEAEAKAAAIKAARGMR